MKNIFKNEETKSLLELVAIYGLLILAIIVLFQGVFMLNYIPSGSMEGSIMTGDVLIATRYDKADVNRYDIMIFTPPDDESSYYIKRVIGLPGETIHVKDGKVYANGMELDQNFIPERQATVGDGVYVVPENCYFMLGDNRNHSLDSRFWNNKYVPVENMVAKARLRVFPFSTMGSIEYDREEAETPQSVTLQTVADTTSDHEHLWQTTLQHQEGTGHVEFKDNMPVWVVDTKGSDEFTTACTICGSEK